MLSSYSVQSPSPSPHFPPLCAPSVSVFSSLPSHSNFELSTLNSLWGFCSGGSSDPCFSPIPHLSNSSLPRTPMAVGCELSTVSRFTPSTYVDAASSISPLFATLTENTGGWGYKSSTQESPLPSEVPILTSLLHYFFTSLSLPFHTPTPATPIPSCAYFTVLCIPNFFQFSPSPPLCPAHCPSGNKPRRQPSYNPAGLCAREVPSWPEL